MKTGRVLLVVGMLLFCALVLSTSNMEAVIVQAAEAIQTQTIHKVIAAPGLTSPDQVGIELVEDYGSFALYRISDSAYAGLPAGLRGRLILADEMDHILLDSYPFNSQLDTLQLPSKLTLEQGAGPGLQLIQFVGPIKSEWLRRIEATGSELVHYIANNAYLVWVTETSQSQLNFLANRDGFLQYRAAYQPYFKLGSTLLDRVAAPKDPEQPITVVIQMYTHAGMEASQAVIAGLAVEQLTPWEPVLAFQNAVVKLRPADLPVVAKLPDVVWVGERFERRLFDEVQGQILASNNSGVYGSPPGGPGYLDWLANRGFSQDPADYPVIDITDDGVGNGFVDSGDPTLHIAGDEANPSRLVYVQNCTSGPDSGGQGGHGHINASIAAGYDVRSGFPYQDSGGFNLGLGINPFGRLAGTRVFTDVFDAAGCGGSEKGVIQASYTAGARISSNSWGCPACGIYYDETSQIYDAAARDADPSQAGNQQMVFVFAAGNTGPRSSTIGSPGNGKNMITVGASENYRPDWTDGCNVSSSGADNVMDIISFSSRGPAPGGRVKPDVVAPGTHIQGTASTHTGYTGDSVCDAYQPAGQSVFTASSGTSHSAPAVSGVASLYYYWLEKTYGIAEPSPAMIKAYLIAHTNYLTGTGANDTLPSNQQGFGMPDMAAAFDQTSRFLLDQSFTFDDSGETWSFTGGVSDPSKPVRIVLAYTDQAGMIGTSPQVNNLDLKVDAGGTIYLGNSFSGRWSVSGGLPDSRNNVEVVFLPPGTVGDLHVTVTAFNIAGDGIPGQGDLNDQDFALVCYNCSDQAGFNLLVEPEIRNTCTPEQAAYDVQVSGILGYASPVTLSAVELPLGVQPGFTSNPVFPGQSSVLAVSGTELVSPGSYVFHVQGTSGALVHTKQVGLNVYNRYPDRPQPAHPSFGSMDQPVRPWFTWAKSIQGATYDIEIAADSNFSQIVEAATGLKSSSFTPQSDLQPGRVYYWRVRSVNSCGPGAYSPTFAFATQSDLSACPVGAALVQVFSEDFESGMDGWTFPASDTWDLVSSRVHSGEYACLGIDPNTVADQKLVSPAVVLPGGQSPLTLQFWNFQSIEDRVSEGCFDGAILEISTDGGVTWSQIPASHLLTDPYDGKVTAAANPLDGLDAWCGDPQDWLNSIVNLDDYGGQTARFRFRLGSDDSYGREGWYLDDIRVQSCNPSTFLAVLGPDSTRKAEPGKRYSHSFTLRNYGLADTYNLSLMGNTWETELSTNSVTLAKGEAVQVTVDVSVPVIDTGAEKGVDIFTLTAASTGNPQLSLSTTGTTVSAVTRGVQISVDQQGFAVPGGQAQYSFDITNVGNLSDSFLLSSSGNWKAEVSALRTPLLQPGESSAVVLTVYVPGAARPGDREITTLRAISVLAGDVASEVHALTYVDPFRIYFPLLSRR